MTSTQWATYVKKKLTLEGWPRRSHFHYFKTYERPFLDVCARVDVTALRQHCRQSGEPLFATMLHHAMASANDIVELRLRFEGDEVYEYERVHPSFTILNEDEAVNFCPADFSEDRKTFLEEVRRRTTALKQNADLYLDEDGRPDFVYVTSLPWIDFQSIGHAWSGDRTDCIPRIAWGKFVDRDGRTEVSVQLTAHHSLVDGLHVARFFDRLSQWEP
jgi:chloramphenicol O-acetyltransferase